MKQYQDATSCPAVAPVLYHGTTADSTVRLLGEGWRPLSWHGGGQCGQTRYLYLSTDYEDALWFSQEKGESVVLAITNVPLSALIVDPEDGTSDTLAEEMNKPHGLPGKVALTAAVPATHIVEVSEPVEADDVATPAGRMIVEAEATVKRLTQTHVSVLLLEDSGPLTRPDRVVIEEITAEPMQQGWGTKAMEAIVVAADRQGVTLTLALANIDDDACVEEDEDGEVCGLTWTESGQTKRLPTESELETFYGRFGFVVASYGLRTIMTRSPAPALGSRSNPSQGLVP